MKRLYNEGNSYTKLMRIYIIILRTRRRTMCRLNHPRWAKRWRCPARSVVYTDTLVFQRFTHADERPRSSIINEKDRGGEFESKKWVKNRESRESEERRQMSNYYLRDSPRSISDYVRNSIIKIKFVNSIVTYKGGGKKA